MNQEMIFLLPVLIVSVCTAAPVNINNNSAIIENKGDSSSSLYDPSDFSTIYNQRQNGTENYRININGVVLVLTPPGSLIQAATLLDPTPFDYGEDYANLEELLKPQSSTTTQKPGVIGSASKENIQLEMKPNASGNLVKVERRRLKVPGFLRPFIRPKENAQNIR